MLRTEQQDPPPALSEAAQLHQYMRARDALRPAFDATWNVLALHFNEIEMNAWSRGVIELLAVNAGTSCLLTYFAISRINHGLNIDALLHASSGGADVCRQAGAKAARVTLAAYEKTASCLNRNKKTSRWWQTITRIAKDAPDAIIPIATNLDTILAGDELDSFDDFIATGLKFAAGHKGRLLRYFTLQEPLARRALVQSADDISFSQVEGRVKVFATALWGHAVFLQSLPPALDRSARVRTSIAGPVIRLPDTYRGVHGNEAISLYCAAAAHAQAHLIYGKALFPVGKLKPLQLALVGLIEDARIEQLAMRDLPGLRRLWAGFHLAQPNGIIDTSNLLARLARALFDPNYADDNGFVEKGRAMFDAARTCLHDRAISREIGMLLGNELGQMRVQFNAKTYVVEPIYRDDGLELFDFGENASTAEAKIELNVGAARIERQKAHDALGQTEPEQTDANVGRARSIAPDQTGYLIAKYPEWDRACRIDRLEWTSVYDVAPANGDPRSIECALDAASGLRGQIRKLVRNARIGRMKRLNKQIEGHDLDLDAAIDTGIAIRGGLPPDTGIFRNTALKHRDLAVTILIDVSESTRDRLKHGASVLDIERIAVAALSEAMNQLGDPFALLAFASSGRDRVNMIDLKSFDAPYDRACIGRLAGLTSGLSTRLGAALRHAGKIAADARSFRKLIIVLTDGEPSDIDISDPLDLVEDARQATLGLRHRGIDAFGVVLGEGGLASASRIFGRGNTMLTRRVEDLPRRLSDLYFRLARR
jgi:Mg-chelatase subunit ChlD